MAGFARRRGLYVFDRAADVICKNNPFEHVDKQRVELFPRTLGQKKEERSNFMPIKCKKRADRYRAQRRRHQMYAGSQFSEKAGNSLSRRVVLA